MTLGNTLPEAELRSFDLFDLDDQLQTAEDECEGSWLCSIFLKVTLLINGHWNNSINQSQEPWVESQITGKHRDVLLYRNCLGEEIGLLWKV